MIFVYFFIAIYIINYFLLVYFGKEDDLNLAGILFLAWVLSPITIFMTAGEIFMRTCPKILTLMFYWKWDK